MTTIAMMSSQADFAAYCTELLAPAVLCAPDASSVGMACTWTMFSWRS